MNNNTTPPIYFVTGLSGAGLSSTLKSLEDLGFEVLDNFPLSLIKSLLSQKIKNPQPIALGIDTRTREFSPENLLNTYRDTPNAKLVFIGCNTKTLQKRFTETRRRHPLAKDRPLMDGIEKEINWLKPLKTEADHYIDTSKLSIHDLRREVEHTCGSNEKQPMTITLMSFGFKYGTPREADMILDVRFLKNPHWIAKLKPKTGKDKGVQQYIETDDNFDLFITNLKNLISPLLPRYQEEGKSYFTLAFGCTGGRHRSVYCAEKLKPWIEDQGLHCSISHRDTKFT